MESKEMMSIQFGQKSAALQLALCPTWLRGIQK